MDYEDLHEKYQDPDQRGTLTTEEIWFLVREYQKKLSKFNNFATKALSKILRSQR